MLAGPPAPAGSSRGTARPLCVNSVHLFDARQLVAEQRARNARLGVASSVTKAQWQRAEIYPVATNAALTVSPAQAALLAFFHGDRSSPG